ncbi:MAG: hypothetical protein KAH23_07325 [Kiritimatiellae bacterium]|nr:hypothetical protein [Kiritimatiellia bacterium]
MQNKQDHIVERMVEVAGHATQSFGVGRVLGQIFAWLYLNKEPQNLDNLTVALGISKGSASMVVRQLEQWRAVEKVWIKGDRKDYYRAKDHFGGILKSAARDLVGKRMEASSDMLHAANDQIAQKNGRLDLSEDDEFLRERIEKIISFQKKARGIWDSEILQMLIK